MQPDGTVLFASRLLTSPVVGVRSGNSGERSRVKPGLWGVNLLHMEWSAIIVHNDLFFKTNVSDIRNESHLSPLTLVVQVTGV